MSQIKNFNFSEGFVLNNKYRILSKLGSGWEGQVFLVEELNTGIKRAAKFFFPIRNIKNKSLAGYAKKLHTLNDVPIIIKYITQEQVTYQGEKVGYLVSEFVEGRTLDQFIKKDLKGRVSVFEGLHIIYEVAKGLETIHVKGEFHGDLHTDNILIRRSGVGFKIKLIDLFLLREKKRENKKNDIVELIYILYEMLGGVKKYQSLPPVVKQIICGKKSNLILNKFPKISSLRAYLENLDWDQDV